MKFASVGVALGAFCLATTAHADPLPRPLPAAGSVIARKSGEEVRFVDISDWRYVDLRQDLLTGDVLRTNATGQLAVLFSDRTQVRLGRNTSLLVKQMGGSGDTGLELQSGTIWARAERGSEGVSIDTPAATAAIRGTDWTMTVGADGKTSLIVLEGLVELSNAHGSVQVAQGEGAVAAIGQAPSKIVVVNSDDREQMLYYLSLREAFNFVPVTNLSGPEMRNERRRIAEIPAEKRDGEDWLTLAEVQMAVNGRQAALDSLLKARAQDLSETQSARADLLEAFIASAEKRYGDAARLFNKARPGLDAKRRSIADYGAYYARSLSEPKHVEKPPVQGNGPYGALAEAYTAGFLQDIAAAIGLLKKAEVRYPDNATLPAVRAKLALLLNDRDQTTEAIARALVIDPQQAIALDARADYRSSINGDIDGALADLQIALASEPGNDMIWNTLGNIQADRDAMREAEKALLQAIALDPQDPLGHVNLAFLYLDELRVAEAKKHIDLALRLDPGFDLSLVARGRYHFQSGQMDKALDDLLAGSVGNPAYSQGQLLLAAALYEKGDRAAFDQALDNADRLDPNDPIISSLRTSIAIDNYDAVGAIHNAQEFLKRSRARGGDFGALSANQDAGSVLNEAFRLQGLDAWGQYYGDAVFDPFTGVSYVDQSVHGGVNPFANSIVYGGNAIDYMPNTSAFSSYIKGLLFDPHMLAVSERRANILLYPFVETSLGGGFTTGDGEFGWTTEAQIQGYSNAPYPISFFGNLQWQKLPVSRDVSDLVYDRVDIEAELLNGTGYLTATPNPDDRVVGYVGYTDSDNLLNYIPNAGIFPASVLSSDNYDSKALNAGVGWSHTFGYRNVTNAAVFFSDQRNGTTLTEIVNTRSGPSGTISETQAAQKSYVGAVNHTYGMGDLTWRYGIEGGITDAASNGRFTSYDPALVPTSTSVQFSEKDRLNIGRAYVDLLYEISPSLNAEAALFGTYLNGQAVDVARLDPRIGVAWSPMDGHWLRAGFMRESYGMDTPTLAPIGVVGLQSNQFQLQPNGYVDTFAVRWDAEWTDRLFTAVDLQHQELRDFSILRPLTVDTIDLDEGRIDRASVTANIALGHGFGLSATAAYADTENRDPGSIGFGNSLSFVPQTAGQIALTWVNEANLKTTIAANYTGKRDSEVLGTSLDGYWTLDANLTWEPLDKRLVLELSAYNLLNEDFQVGAAVPGWGRAVKGSLKVRF